MPQNNQDTPQVKFITITEEHHNQRLDNFLISKLKGVPKSMIYRIIRKGEIRINKGRTKPEYKLQINDVVRIPPVHISNKSTTQISSKLNKVSQLEQQILFEDESLLILNKPSGIAVHGGSGINFGVIEALRAIRPQAKFLELVHRLDRETSGVLIIAKKRSALKELHRQLREKAIQKNYLALVQGQWLSQVKRVTAPLLKNELASGERVVKVSADGKPAQTNFAIVQNFSLPNFSATLIKASPITGRTHQIRVHTLHASHPIAMDSKYGDKIFNQQTESLGLKRLFLHAVEITFIHPKTQETMKIQAPLSEDLNKFLQNLG